MLNGVLFHVEEDERLNLQIDLETGGPRTPQRLWSAMCAQGPRTKLLSKVGTCLMQDESSYICDACGEEIVIPVDLSEGASQQYVEDCPVCCRANVIRVEIDPEGNVEVWAELEHGR